MEDSFQSVVRRGSRRPESALSNHTRMTGTTSSTNSSAAQVPGRAGNGGKSLLQERLRERKVECARQSRGSVDMSAERGTQSSPIKGGHAREERRPSSSGVTAAKGLGVKQMEDQVSTLHKQNFDLKLELYHRRQRQEELEARLEATEKQIEEQAEMQEVNEQLLAELERRDQALDEAVGVIVQLEDKVDSLMMEREMVLSIDAQLDANFERDLSGSPPAVKEETPKKPSQAMVRMPSFLSENSEGTEALRSLYMPRNYSYSDATMPKLQEEEHTDCMNSPRLSVLSESSFLSVYGDKLALDNPDEPEFPRRHRTSSSVEKWIDERPAPQKLPARPSPEVLHRKQYLSINDVLESPLQRLEKLRHTLEKNDNLQPDQDKEKRNSKVVLKKTLKERESFGEQPTLPPTPDTISTNTLHRYQHSSDSLAQDHKERKSLLHRTEPFAPSFIYNSVQASLSLRPRSAGETVTSRREGHGWDTETQEDLTETGSLGSTSTYDAPFSRIKRVVTPELFTFGTSPEPDEGNSWGREVMFSHNRTQSMYPDHSRYDSARRSSMIEHSRNDDTVIPRRRPDHGTQLQRFSTPADLSSVPDRRSSLSAAAKPRRINPYDAPISAVGSGANSQPSIPSGKEILKDGGKNFRLPSRLFGRSDPVGSPHTREPEPKSQVPAHQRPRHNLRAQSYLDGGYGNGDLDRATPPPIRRNRTAHRPSSAGTGMAARRTSNFDGARLDLDGLGLGRREVVDTADKEHGVEGEKSSGRKWFNGLRRG